MSTPIWSSLVGSDPTAEDCSFISSEWSLECKAPTRQNGADGLLSNCSIVWFAPHYGWSVELRTRSDEEKNSKLVSRLAPVLEPPTRPVLSGRAASHTRGPGGHLELLLWKDTWSSWSSAATGNWLQIPGILSTVDVLDHVLPDASTEVDTLCFLDLFNTFLFYGIFFITAFLFTETWCET